MAAEAPPRELTFQDMFVYLDQHGNAMRDNATMGAYE